MAEKICAFVAIGLPPFVIKKITEVQNQFKSLDLDIAWVKPENVHLTLRFLGNITTWQISEITLRLAEIAGKSSKFEISLTHLGVFPNLNHPKVLWVGLENSENYLEILQKKVAEQIQTIGFEPETKNFRPHLTFARMKSPRGKESLKQKLQSFPKIFAKAIGVYSIKLYKSHFTPRGYTYTVLETFAFKN